MRITSSSDSTSEHDVLQSGSFARHAWSESDAVMARVAAQEAQTNVVVDEDPIAQAKTQHTCVKVMRPLGVRYRQQHVAQAEDTQVTGIAHRLFVDLKAVGQSQRVSIGVRELDKISHVPFGTLLAVPWRQSIPSAVGFVFHSASS